jgi:site-specific DNA-methyltransferase (adenine-specific)
VSPAPFYDDGQVTLYCADFRAVDVVPGSVTAVVTSPPYNVGVDYHGGDDSLDWPRYWGLAAAAANVMAGALVEGGRAWVNTAVSIPTDPPASGPHSGRAAKARVMLAHRWAIALEDAGLNLVDQVAWCSPRGAGTAWGSWESPSSPNLRGDWESLLVASRGGWERTPPVGADDWRDGVGGWASLCSTVWQIAPARRDRHPAPFPVELARRAIRLSTWPDETVFDLFAGSCTTLLAARQLGRRAIGIERSERYCELAVGRLAQMGFDFKGAA